MFSLFLLMSLPSFANTQKSNRVIAQEAKLLLEDSVRKVIPFGSSDKIHFNTHAGVYYLRSDSKHYESIKAAFLASEKSGEKVQVKVDPTSLEIEELVLQAK